VSRRTVNELSMKTPAEVQRSVVNWAAPPEQAATIGSSGKTG